jgi:hypothetical protein
MTKSIIDLSTEKLHECKHLKLVLYSASFILGDDDLPTRYSEISDRMKEALKAHNRFYQWIIIPERKVVYTKFADLGVEIC